MFSGALNTSLFPMSFPWSLIFAPYSLAPGGWKIIDPGNEVGLFSHNHSKFSARLDRVVTRMDTLKSGWTHYVCYTTHLFSSVFCLILWLPSCILSEDDNLIWSIHSSHNALTHLLWILNQTQSRVGPRRTKKVQLLTLDCHFKLTRISISFCVLDFVSDVSFKQLKCVTTVVWLVHFCDFYIVTECWLNPGHRLGSVAGIINVFRTVVNCRRCHVWEKNN